MFFLAVAYVDNYYAKNESLPRKDLQLTAIVAIFIASKLLETACLKMDFCVSTLGHGKFTRDIILEKESAIIHSLDWEINLTT